MKKYKLLPASEHKVRVAPDEWRTVMLHQIVALQTFTTKMYIRSRVEECIVYECQLGGFVMSEENLSQTGLAWIDQAAKVFDDARVLDNAWIGGHSLVFDQAIVSGDAQIASRSRISGSAKILDSAWVIGASNICGEVQIGNQARVCSSNIKGSIKVFGRAVVDGMSALSGEALITDNARIVPKLVDDMNLAVPQATEFDS